MATHDTTASVPPDRNATSSHHGEALSDNAAAAAAISNADAVDMEKQSAESTIATSDRDDEVPPFLDGWRLQVLTSGLCLSLFLTQVETTIVSTSLVSITDEFEDFQAATWIVTAYLLTYTAFLTPLTKLSDIYGRRAVFAGCLILFIAFSAGCGWSRSMAQLCIFRAFQGIGGGGVFALCFVFLPEMVKPKLYMLYTTIFSSTLALSNLLGPLLGGLINNHTTWRWIFWFNLPAGVVAFALVLIALPANFPYHNRDTLPASTSEKRSLERVDLIGCFLLIAATTLIVAALETGGISYPWSNATPISLLCVSVACWVCFYLWQWLQSRQTWPQEPLMPWRLVNNRFTMGLFMASFFGGAALITAVIVLPIRFQAVDGLSPFDAGYRLLALTLASPFGSSVAGVLMQKAKLPPQWTLLIGAILQTVGFAAYAGADAPLLNLRNSVYGLEVLMGLGIGMTMAVAIMAIPAYFEARDIAVAMGVVAQFRMLGGCLGTSGVANIHNKLVQRDLTGILSPDELAELSKSLFLVQAIGGEAQQAYRRVFARTFQWEMVLVTCLSALAISAAFLLWERRPRKVFQHIS